MDSKNITRANMMMILLEQICLKKIRYIKGLDNLVGLQILDLSENHITEIKNIDNIDNIDNY